MWSSLRTLGAQERGPWHGVECRAIIGSLANLAAVLTRVDHAHLVMPKCCAKLVDER